LQVPGTAADEVQLRVVAALGAAYAPGRDPDGTRERAVTFEVTAAVSWERPAQHLTCPTQALAFPY
jgi:hypothetical protein